MFFLKRVDQEISVRAAKESDRELIFKLIAFLFSAFVKGMGYLMDSACCSGADTPIQRSRLQLPGPCDQP